MRESVFRQSFLLAFPVISRAAFNEPVMLEISRSAKSRLLVFCFMCLYLRLSKRKGAGNSPIREDL